MDKIFSARLDESIIQRVRLLAQHLHTSKKNIIETAIRFYTKDIEEKEKIDPLEYSFGAWQRRESAGQLTDKIRKAFNQSMKRHQP